MMTTSPTATKVCPKCSVATEGADRYCPHCGTAFAVQLNAAASATTWKIVAAVLAVLLAIVWFIGRSVVQERNEELEDRVRNYTDETIDCALEGHSEAYCVRLYE